MIGDAIPVTVFHHCIIPTAFSAVKLVNRLAVKLALVFFVASCSGDVREPVCPPFCENGTWLLQDFVVSRFFCGIPRYGSQFDSLLISGMDTWEVKRDTFYLATADEGQALKYVHRIDHDTLLLVSRKDSVRFVVKQMSADTIRLELRGVFHTDLVLVRQK